MKKAFHGVLIAFLVVAQALITVFVNAENIGVNITSPRDGTKIYLARGESMPAVRMIKGEVTGFSSDDIARRQLTVTVSIKTNKWYPQGTASVSPEGRWILQQAYFGGAVHLIKATLTDNTGMELSAATATVTLVQ